MHDIYTISQGFERGSRGAQAASVAFAGATAFKIGVSSALVGATMASKEQQLSARVVVRTSQLVVIRNVQRHGLPRHGL